MVFAKQTLAAALALALMGMAGLSARANSVSIETGSANWQYVSTTSADGALPGAVSVIASPNAAWSSAATYLNTTLGTSAQWVGTSTAGGTTGYHGNFVFSLTFAATDFSPPVGNAQFLISGLASADNEILSMSLSDTYGNDFPLSLTKVYDNSGSNTASAFGFYRVFSFNDSQNLTTPLTLTLTINNDNLYSSADPANPLGFIMAGTIEALPPAGGATVPLPASVYSGLGLLGMMAACKLRRKLA